MKRLPALLLLAIATSTLACSPPSADELVEDVMRIRLQYEVEARSWIIREDSDPPEIYIEAFVINNNQVDALRTLTVLVEQFDAEGELVGSDRVALEITDLTPGIGRSLGVTVPLASQDVDGLILRREVRPEEDVWREFPEFEAVRPRI